MEWEPNDDRTGTLRVVEMQTSQEQERVRLLG